MVRIMAIDLEKGTLVIGYATIGYTRWWDPS
jgi:hypothetical protein